MPNEASSSPVPSESPVSAETLTETLGGLFAALLSAEGEEGAAMAEVVKSDPNTQRALEAVLDLKPEHFHLFWEYPHSKRTRGLLAVAGLKPFSPVAELFSGYTFYENHFKYVYTTFEGNACCADKSRWALRALARHLATGLPIPDEQGEHSYWRPRTVLTTHDAIVAFFDALRQLRYGRPDGYLKAMLDMRLAA